MPSPKTMTCWCWCTLLCAIDLIQKDSLCVKTKMRSWKEATVAPDSVHHVHVFLATDLFSFSRRARVHWSCSLSWCSRWASSMCCPQGESWSRAGLEWRRRYWSSSLSPPHRRQHTEPPAHSHQQHKAEPRTAWKSRQAKARQGKQGEERYYGTRRSQTRPDRRTGHYDKGIALCQVHSPNMKCSVTNLAHHTIKNPLTLLKKRRWILSYITIYWPNNKHFLGNGPENLMCRSMIVRL